MKRYGCRCGPNNDCNVLAGAGWMCETDGQGNCSEWAVGDFAVWHLTGDELQTALELSKTKFYGKFNDAGHLVLEEVGMLADAGLQKGDVLISVLENENAGVWHSMKYNAENILTWQFTAKELLVIYRREGKGDSSVMKNPAYKEVTL